MIMCAHIYYTENKEDQGDGSQQDKVLAVKTWEVEPPPRTHIKAEEA